MKTKITHTKQNMLMSVKALGIVVIIDDNTGMAKTFDDQYYLDVLEHLIVDSRAIACTKDEYDNLKLGELQKVI